MKRVVALLRLGKLAQSASPIDRQDEDNLTKTAVNNLVQFARIPHPASMLQRGCRMGVR